MLQFDLKHALPFLPENWLSSRLDGLTEARRLLEQGTGLGGEFTGWVDLPDRYDRRELHRLCQTARIIRDQSQVLVVIGIGGSYLGARALLELLTSPNYNLLCRETPQIFFTGNTLSPDAITELLDYVRDRDFSVNVVSKSGNTTEPAAAFLLFRQLLEEKYGREGSQRPDLRHHRPPGGHPARPGRPGGLRHLLRAPVHRRALLGPHPRRAAAPGRGRAGPGSHAHRGRRRPGHPLSGRPGQPRLAVCRRPERPLCPGQGHRAAGLLRAPPALFRRVVEAALRRERGQGRPGGLPRQRGVHHRPARHGPVHPGGRPEPL